MSNVIGEDPPYQWNTCRKCGAEFQTAFDEHWDECFTCMEADRKHDADYNSWLDSSPEAAKVALQCFRDTPRHLRPALYDTIDCHLRQVYINRENDNA